MCDGSAASASPFHPCASPDPVILPPSLLARLPDRGPDFRKKVAALLGRSIPNIDPEEKS